MSGHTRSIELLPWSVIEHWLSAHWDHAGPHKQGGRA